MTSNQGLCYALYVVALWQLCERMKPRYFRKQNDEGKVGHSKNARHTRMLHFLICNPLTIIDVLT